MLGALKKLFGGGKATPKPAAAPAAPQQAAAQVATAAAQAVPTATHHHPVLDCRNMNCPMPIVQVAGAVRSVPVGGRLTVLATDPAFRADIEAWVRKTGNTLLSFEEGQFLTAVIQKQQG